MRIIYSSKKPLSTSELDPREVRIENIRLNLQDLMERETSNYGDYYGDTKCLFVCFRGDGKETVEQKYDFICQVI